MVSPSFSNLKEILSPTVRKIAKFHLTSHSGHMTFHSNFVDDGSRNCHAISEFQCKLQVSVIILLMEVKFSYN